MDVRIDEAGEQHAAVDGRRSGPRVERAAGRHVDDAGPVDQNVARPVDEALAVEQADVAERRRRDAAPPE